MSTPRKPWRWRTLALLAALGLGATALALTAALVVARPAVLMFPLNWMLGDLPIRVTVDGARLEAPAGWATPSRWQWRFGGLSLVSHQPGTPTLLSDVVVVRMPDLARSWRERSLVLPRVDAKGFAVSVLDPHFPPPFDEVDGWPLRGIVIEQGVLRGFEVVIRDASGTTILLDQIDGQVVGFRYDLGRRQMFGRGATRGAHVVVGPIEAKDVQAIPVAFAGTTMEAHGYGYVAGQRTGVLFAIDGLFRPAAAIHAEFDMQNADVRALLVEILGDGAPDVNGALWGQAIFDSKPPEDSHLDLTFRLEDGQITLAEETKAIVMTALKLAPFVEVDDHLLRLGKLSGRVDLTDGVITLTNGRYEAERSAAQVDGRVGRTSLRGRVRFSPEPGQTGMSWGILLSGTAKQPKLQLADQPVLEAWSLDGADTQEDIREDVHEARRDRRELMRESRQAQRDGEPGEPAPDGTVPGLVGPVERLE